MGQGSTILGLGAYIPDEIRTNDWWPKSLVQIWQAKEKKNEINLQESKDNAQERESLHPALAREVDKIKNDPFGGTKERRVAPVAMLPSDMEVAACREALENAHVRPEAIDLILCFSLPPDVLIVPNCFKVANALGLTNARCVGINSICHSFMTMIDLAHLYISSGAVKHALLVASTKYSAIMDYSSSISVAAGDGACAAVMGSCPEGKGVLASRHYCEPVFHDSMIVTRRPPIRPMVPAFSWGEVQSVEKMFFTINKPALARGAVAIVPRFGERLRKELFDSGLFAQKDIQLFVTNAAFCWYTPVLAQVVGIPMDKVEDNIDSFSNMGAVNLGMNLYTAVKKKRVKDGDQVLMLGHGGGMSYGGIVMRWHQPHL
jgi:3-oxoacyl-[acyl-carrier-protein] synthase-3